GSSSEHFCEKPSVACHQRAMGLVSLQRSTARLESHDLLIWAESPIIRTGDQGEPYDRSTR
ncbi:MAG TPA: hypothetical protein VEI53_12935, partial [Ktedonobacteraceae bacterium]|nr:hypothetical protein [Ktedonobacteraceae bacterium]